MTTSGHTFVTCPDCGRPVAHNYLGCHRESDCTIGARRVVNGERSALTQREVQVVRRLAMDGGRRGIAEDLGIAESTVAEHVTSAMKKLDAYYSGTALLMEALRRGEVAMEELVAPAHVLGGTHDTDTN